MQVSGGDPIMVEWKKVCERAERRCQMSQVCNKVRVKEVSLAHMENAGYTLFVSPMRKSIMSAKGQRKVRHDGIDSDFRVVSRNVSLFQHKRKHQ